MKKMTHEECKKEMINILKYIDDICKENDIKYSLIDGSLIGAIRHKGIIPWDDDIDIGLLYNDYKKLIELLKKDESKYKVLDNETCKNYYTIHTKLVSKKTHLVEKDYDEIDDMGIFVDIFVYMYVPENEKKRKKFFRKLVFNNKMISGLRKPNKTENLYLLRKLRYFFSKYVIGREKLYKENLKLYKKYNSGRYIVSNFPQCSFKKEIQNADFFDEVIRAEFENIEVFISNKYDKFLKTKFGDYMKLPPKNERVSHGLKAFWRNEYEKFKK